jgi:hypothetical protein
VAVAPPAAGPPASVPKTSKCKKSAAIDLEKPIGHEHYPITGYSLTISKVKGDIPANIIDIVGDFISTTCIRGSHVSIFLCFSQIFFYLIHCCRCCFCRSR